jgi:putative transposase
MGEKKVKGRKRQILAETNGLLLRTLVHAADITDSEGGEWIIQQHHTEFPRLERIRVDQGYKDEFATWMEAYTKLTPEIVEKPANQQGFAVIPKRWVVERTIAWLCRNRRLSKEYDRRPESTESWIYLASIHLMLKRLHPSY